MPFDAIPSGALPTGFKLALPALARALAELGSSVLIGGAAIVLLGRPRVTQDLDATVMRQDRSIEDILAIFANHEIVPREEYRDALARHSSILLLVHEPSGVRVDVGLGSIPFETEVIARALRIEVEGVEIPVARPQDLVILKMFAFRNIDLFDVETLVRSDPTIDRRYVVRMLKSFEEVFGDDERTRAVKKIFAAIPAA